MKTNFFLLSIFLNVFWIVLFVPSFIFNDPLLFQPRAGDADCLWSSWGSGVHEQTRYGAQSTQCTQRADGLQGLNFEHLMHLWLSFQFKQNSSVWDVMLSLQENVKLAKFGFYHMTDHGADVDFPIGWVVFSSFIRECSGRRVFWNFSSALTEQGQLSVRGQRFNSLWWESGEKIDQNIKPKLWLTLHRNYIWRHEDNFFVERLELMAWLLS